MMPDSSVKLLKKCIVKLMLVRSSLNSYCYSSCKFIDHLKK